MNLSTFLFVFEPKMFGLVSWLSFPIIALKCPFIRKTVCIPMDSQAGARWWFDRISTSLAQPEVWLFYCCRVLQHHGTFAMICCVWISKRAVNWSRKERTTRKQSRPQLLRPNCWPHLRNKKLKLWVAEIDNAATDRFSWKTIVVAPKKPTRWWWWWSIWLN